MPIVFPSDHHYHDNLKPQQRSAATGEVLRDTVPRVSDTKSLPPEMRARIIAAVEKLIAEHPEKNLREVAEAVGIEQPLLSAMRKGRSIGIGALLKLRAATGETIDDLLGLDPPPRRRPPPPPDSSADLNHRIRAAVAAALDERARQTPPTEPPTKGPVPDAPRPRRR